MKRSAVLILGLFSMLLSREALATEMTFACNYELGREHDAGRRKIGSVVLAIDVDAKTARIDFGKGWFKTVAFRVDGTGIKETGPPASGPELGFFYFDLTENSGGFTGGGDLREFFDACVRTKDTARASEDAHARSAAVNTDVNKGLPTLTPSSPIVPTQPQPKEQGPKGQAAQYPRDGSPQNKPAATDENAPPSANEKTAPAPAIALAVPAAPASDGQRAAEDLSGKPIQIIPTPAPEIAQGSSAAKAGENASAPVVVEAAPAEPSPKAPETRGADETVASNTLERAPPSAAQSPGGKEAPSASVATPIPGTEPGLRPGEEHGMTAYFGSKDAEKSPTSAPESAVGPNSEKMASVSDNQQPVGEADSSALSPVASGSGDTVEPCRAALSAEVASAKVNFANSSFWIAPESRRELEKIAQIIRDCRNVGVEVAGHTDNWGSPIDNQRLSQLRAEVVVRFLIGVGVDPSKLKAIGFGQEQPIATNATAEGRRTNRRVELRVSTTTSSN